MDKNYLFDCEFCELNIEGTMKDYVINRGKDHLLNEHKNQVRGHYSPNRQRRKCGKESCNVYVKQDLFCAHGHDNLNSYIEWLTKHFTKSIGQNI